MYYNKFNIMKRDGLKKFTFKLNSLVFMMMKIIKTLRNLEI